MRRNCNARAATVAGGLMPRKLATARGLEPWLLPQESGFNFFPLVVQLQVVAVAGLREPRCWNLERKGTKFWFRRSPIAPSQKTLLENAAKRLQVATHSS